MNVEEARERILSAAEDLYYQKGYSAVGMDELRARAGVSLRRLYALFPSKTDIITAVLARKRDEWESGLTGWIGSAPKDPREGLLAIYAYLEEWFTTDSFRGCAFINAFGELGGTHPEITALVRDQKSSFQRYVSALVRDIGASDDLAAQLSILAEGAQSTAAIADDPTAARQARAAAETLIDVALKAA